MAGEETAFAKPLDLARRSGVNGARRLHVAEPQPGPPPSRGPGGGGEVGVERQHEHWGCLRRPGPRPAGHHSPCMCSALTSTIASHTASICTSRSAATLSWGVWLASVPFAISTQSNPAAFSAFASLPPPVATSRGSTPQRRSASRATLTDGELEGTRYARNISVTAMSTSHSYSLAAQVQASTIAPTVRLARSSSRLRASPLIRHRPGTTFEAAPPEMTPTFAVVASSRRPRLIPETAAAAAWIALRPSSGRVPACASAPPKPAPSRLLGGAAGITPPLGLAWWSPK